LYIIRNYGSFIDRVEKITIFMSLKKWKLKKSEIVFEHKWYKLRKDEVELPNGRVVDDYFVSVRPNVVVIFALTDNDEVVLVRQYKHGVQQIVTELPGGVVDDDEDFEEAARRELLEETGYSSHRFEKIATLFDNPTKDTNKINLYFAKDAKKKGEQALDENEEIEVHMVKKDLLQGKILSGEINVSGSVAGILLALNYLSNEK
jgi:ADP-ribose pyrophosphatase